MKEIKEIVSIEEWKELYNHTNAQPILLIKHSTTCPISTEGLQQFEKALGFAEKANVLPILVKVMESRPVSNQITEDTGVKHESPQVLLIRNQEVVWHASHWKITKSAVEESLTPRSS